MERELSPRCKHTHLHIHSLSLSLTHSLRQLTVSSPLCHIKDAANLWVSVDTERQTHRYTHTACSAASHLLSGWDAVWEVILHVFLRTVCVCMCWCLFTLQVECREKQRVENLSFIISITRNHEGQTHTHQIQTVSKQCHYEARICLGVLISVCNRVVTERERSDCRKSGQLRE